MTKSTSRFETTLTKCATHVDTCHNIDKTFHRLVRGVTRVGIFYNTRRIAFTLAEVLMTLGIIGIVSAMTIPTLVSNFQQRHLDTSANSFNRKLGEALKVMNTQSALAGHKSTKDFVGELGKHIKIIKVCDSSKLKECFAEEFATNNATYKVNKLKKSENINNNDNYGTETMGVMFIDGTSALIAYNKNAKQDPYDNRVVGVSSAGSGLKNRSIGLSTDAIAILYDVSGPSGVNVYGADAKGNLKDIRGLNVSINPGVDVLNVGTKYSGLYCTDEAKNSALPATKADFEKYCGGMTFGINYWAGAQKACAIQGMRLPDKDELLKIYNSRIEGMPTSGWVWSSTINNGVAAYAVDFGDGRVMSHRCVHCQYEMVCISD